MAPVTAAQAKVLGSPLAHSATAWSQYFLRVPTNAADRQKALLP